MAYLIYDWWDIIYYHYSLFYYYVTFYRRKVELFRSISQSIPHTICMYIVTLRWKQQVRPPVGTSLRDVERHTSYVSTSCRTTMKFLFCANHRIRMCVAFQPRAQGAVGEGERQRERVSYTSTCDFSGAPWNAHGSRNGAYLRADLWLFSPLSYGSRPGVSPATLRGICPRNYSSFFSPNHIHVRDTISVSSCPRPFHPSRDFRTVPLLFRTDVCPAESESFGDHSRSIGGTTSLVRSR